MIRLPAIPAYEERRKLGELPVGEGSRDAGQAIRSLQVIPEALRLAVVKHKCIAIRPTARCKRQNLTVDFPAVHGSQSDQRSPANGHVHIDECLIDDLVTIEMIDAIRTALPRDRRSNDEKSLIGCGIARIAR
jgi:hypothetical protein